MIFAAPRFSRRIYADRRRGRCTRRIWEPSKRRQGRCACVIVGIDQVKTEILQRLPLPAFNEEKQPTPGGNSSIARSAGGMVRSDRGRTPRGALRPQSRGGRISPA